MCVGGLDDDEVECGECVVNEKGGFYGWMSE